MKKGKSSSGEDLYLHMQIQTLCNEIQLIQDMYDNPAIRAEAKIRAIAHWKRMNPGKSRPPIIPICGQTTPRDEAMSCLSDDDAILSAMLTLEQCKKYGILKM